MANTDVLIIYNYGFGIPPKYMPCIQICQRYKSDKTITKKYAQKNP